MDTNNTALTVLTVLTPVLVVLLTGVGWLYRHERERRTAAEHQVSERKYQAGSTVPSTEPGRSPQGCSRAARRAGGVVLPSQP